MRVGATKHSSKLTEADIACEQPMRRVFGQQPLTLANMREGYYIRFGNSLKGPFNNPDQAKEAYREWVWEAKYS